MKEGEILRLVQQTDKPISREIFGAGFNTGRKNLQEQATSIPLPEGYTDEYWMARGIQDASTVLSQDVRMSKAPGQESRELIEEGIVGVVTFAMHLAERYGIQVDEAVAKRAGQQGKPKLRPPRMG